MRTHADHPAGLVAHTPRSEGQACDHRECAAAGTYRAPKGPDRLRDYYWFCLEHVRAYNSAWNYCAGFSDADIERQIRAATCWERPTWRLGHWRSGRLEDAIARFAEGFEVDPDAPKRDNRSRQGENPAHPSGARDRALAVLGLATAATQAEIKARYKRLAKRYHPDTNGGDKQAEERLKVINQAYATLRMRPPA